jgi:site-specific recombinase
MSSRNYKKHADKVIAAFLRWNTKKDLDYILSHADPEAMLPDKIQWLADLINWIRKRSRLPGNFSEFRGQLQAVRIKFVFHLLERHPEWRDRVGRTLVSILSETSARKLFCHTGMSSETGLVNELLDRILSRILPSPLEARDLSQLFSRVFTKGSDAEWVRDINSDSVQKIYQLVSDHSHGRDPFFNLKQDMAQALFLLGAQATGSGLRDEVLSRSLHFENVQSSPFFALSASLKEYVELYAQKQSPASGPILRHIEECHRTVEEVFKKLESSGVSVGLVYELEKITGCLLRMKILLGFLSGKGEGTAPAFIAQLIDEQNGRTSIRGLLASTFHQLSRKIVERAGESGEHYITRSRQEYFQMFRSGCGGGALTALTTLLKYWISYLGLPLFIEGVFTSVNYSLSFLGIYACGFTLATKQPAMTAPALAGKLASIGDSWQESRQDSRALKGFLDEVTRIARSQFIAVVGNVGTVIPVCLLLDFIWRQISHAPCFSPTTATYVLHSLNPFAGLTIFYAAFTGVLLWASSILAGTVENWMVYRKLPDALSQHTLLQKILGKRRTEKFGKNLAHHTSGVAGNVILGFLLGMTPVFAKFFGAPLDVRHVTLSSGALALAISAKGPASVLTAEVALPCLGILVIGFFNFAVSFFLALTVAIRARNIQAPGRGRVRDALLQHFRRFPGDFFLPR